MNIKRRALMGPSFWVGGACELESFYQHFCEPCQPASLVLKVKHSAHFLSLQFVRRSETFCVVQLQRSTEPHLSHAPPDYNVRLKGCLYTC